MRSWGSTNSSIGMPSPSALLRLIRWENALISAAGILVGAWWVGGSPVARQTLWAAAAAVCLAALANAFNDLCDIEIDRIAHPTRPLPSGELSVRAARAVVVVAGLVGLLCSYFVFPEMAAASVGVIGLMLLYSRVLKQRGLVGNFTVAILASLPFLYGGWSAGRPLASLSLVALAVPLHLAREIAKDIEDAAGDAGVRRTLPVSAGSEVTRGMLMLSLGAFLGGLTLFARGRPLFVLAVLPAVVLAVYATLRAMQGRRGAPLIFKSAMLCAMASLLIVREH